MSCYRHCCRSSNVLVVLVLLSASAVVSSYHHPVVRRKAASTIRTSSGVPDPAFVVRPPVVLPTTRRRPRPLYAGDDDDVVTRRRRRRDDDDDDTTAPVTLTDPTSLFNRDIARMMASEHATSREVASEAHGMLRHMVELHRSGHDTVRPNRDTFLLVLEACGQAHADQDGKKRKRNPAYDDPRHNTTNREHRELMEALHRQMVELWEKSDGDDRLAPTTRTYNLLLRAVAPSGDVDRVEELLTDMTADVETWEHVVHAWSVHALWGQDPVRLSSYADKINDCLGRMADGLHANHHRHFLRACQHVTNVYARKSSSHREASKLADSVLRRVEHDVLPELHSHSDHHHDVTVITNTNTVVTNIYTSVLLTHTRQHRAGAQAARRATDTLYGLVEQCKRQQSLALASLQDTEEEEDFFKDVDYQDDTVPIMEPHVTAFNAVLSAWARCSLSSPEAVTEAEAVFALLRRLSDNEDDAGFRTRYLQPDLVTYNTLLNVVGKAAPSSSSSHDVLARIHELLEESGRHPRRTPDSFTYNAAVTGLLRHGAPPRAVQDLLGACPDKENNLNVRHYAAVMNAYARARRPQPEECEGLLSDMAERGLADAVSYTTAIDAWGKSRHPDRGRRALRLLETMTTTHNNHAHRHRQVAPTVRTYAAVLAALAGQRGHAKAACGLLETMAERGVRPNVYCFNHAIHACAKGGVDDVDTNKSDFAGAVAVFRRAHREDDDDDDEYAPNSLTYAFFFKAVSTLGGGVLSETRRTELIDTTFRLCRERGCVNGRVLFRLRAALFGPHGDDHDDDTKERVWAEILDIDYRERGDRLEVSVHDLNREWSRNAV